MLEERREQRRTQVGEEKRRKREKARGTRDQTVLQGEKGSRFRDEEREARDKSFFRGIPFDCCCKSVAFNNNTNAKSDCDVQYIAVGWEQKKKTFKISKLL
jgi:hypothetical protein